MRKTTSHFAAGGRTSAAVAAAATAALTLTATAASVRVAQADSGAYPVRAVLIRQLGAPAPAGADAVRLSILGDGSGTKVQIRLLSSSDASLGMAAYYAAPAVALDFTGWKTVTLPLSDFSFRSDQSPETNAASSVASVLSSLDAIEIAASAAPAGKVFVDDLAWVKADSGPTDAPLAVIDDFEGPDVPSAPTAWRLTGGYDQLNSAVVTFNQTASFVKSGKGSLQLDVRAPSLQEKQLYGATLNKRLKATPGLPYVVYSRPAFQAIRPDSTPKPAEIAQPAAVSVFGCAGQIEPASFSVYSAADLKDATVKIVGPFLSESKQSSLPPSAIDVRVVRIGDGRNLSDFAGPVPELLMKDDRESMDGAMPTVRLTGDPTTDIAASSSKQFWVTVKIPKSQLGSVYRGKLVFSAAGVKPTAIPLKIEVLPMTLRTAFLQYGIDMHSRLSADGGSPDDLVVTPETYAAELANVRDHGFRIVTLNDPLSTLPQAMKLYKDAGLSNVGPVVVSAPLHTKDEVSQVEALRSTIGLGPEFDIYYQLPSDLAPAGGEANDSSLKDYIKAVRSASRKALVVAPCSCRATYSALSPTMDNSTLAPIFAATSDYTETLLATGKREITNRDYWSWNIGREDPAHNRMLAGFLICKTGTKSSPLYGAFPGPYQRNTPDGERVAYVVNGGVVDTIQWEAVRAGIDDVRYYGALKYYTRLLKDARLRKDATDQAELYLTTLLQRPLWALSASDYHAMRRGIADQSLKLYSVVRAKLGSDN